MFCCGGGSAAANHANIKINGQIVTVPYRVENGSKGTETTPKGDGKQHVIWNLDNVDVATHFHQRDLHMPPEGGEIRKRLQAMRTLLDIRSPTEGGPSDACETQCEKVCPFHKKSAAKNFPTAKVVRVYRYYVGHEHSEYWNKREARVIEIRHQACWWYIVADGIPVRCLQHEESGMATKPKNSIHTVPFTVSEYTEEMGQLFEIEHPKDPDASQKMKLVGQTLNGSCKMRWSQKKQKWSYAVEVNRCPVPAMWSAPNEGVSKADFNPFSQQQDECNVPKTAYMPDVLYEKKNLYSFQELANNNGEYLLVQAKTREDELAYAKKEAANKTKNGSELAEASKDIEENALDVLGAIKIPETTKELKANFNLEYKTARVWRFTLDHELRGVEVAHQDHFWYILVDGQRLKDKDGNDTGVLKDAKGGGSYDKGTKMWGCDFQIYRNPVKNEGFQRFMERTALKASMKITFLSNKQRWEYLLIINDNEKDIFIPQCGWRGNPNQPRDFCALEVPEIVPKGDPVLALENGGEPGNPVGVNSGCSTFQNKEWKQKEVDNVKQVKDNNKAKMGAWSVGTAPPKTAAVFNCTTKFKLRSVALLHSGCKWQIIVDGKPIMDTKAFSDLKDTKPIKTDAQGCFAHGSNHFAAMTYRAKFQMPELGAAEESSTPVSGGNSRDQLAKYVDKKSDAVPALEAVLTMTWGGLFNEWKWSYRLDVKNTAGVMIKIDPLFNWGMAPRGKAPELLADTGIKARDTAAALAENELPQTTVLDKGVGHEDGDIYVKDKHGFSKGDFIVVNSLVKEVLRISGFDPSTEEWQKNKFEGPQKIIVQAPRVEAESTDDGKPFGEWIDPAWDSSERVGRKIVGETLDAGRYVDYFEHESATEVSLFARWGVVAEGGVAEVDVADKFKVKLDDMFRRVSNTLRFHPGTVEMARSSFHNLKYLASLLRYLPEDAPLKITGYTGEKADVFESQADLEFLGLRRAMFVRKTIQEYLEKLHGKKNKHIAVEGAGYSEGALKIEDTFFACTVERMSPTTDDNGEHSIQEQMEKLKEKAQRLSESEEAARASKHYEITKNRKEADEPQRGRARTATAAEKTENPEGDKQPTMWMAVSGAMQNFVYEPATVAPGIGRRTDKKKTTQGDSLKSMEVAQMTNQIGFTSVKSSVNLGEDDQFCKVCGVFIEVDSDFANYHDIVRRGITRLMYCPDCGTKRGNSEDAEALNESEYQKLGMMPVGHKSSNSRAACFPAYDIGVEVEFFSRTHSRWLAAIVTKITLEPSGVYYDLEFTRNRQIRRLVSMDVIRMPLAENEAVEVFSKKTKWTVGKIIGNNTGAASVGYTVSTDAGEFGQVPAHRFRRRFEAGTTVHYYRSIELGWQDAKVGLENGDRHNGQVTSNMLLGEPRERAWLQTENVDLDKQFKKQRPNESQEETLLGPAVSPDAKASNMSAASTATPNNPSGMGAAVGATPLFSNMSAADASRFEALSEGMEPWTEICLTIPDIETVRDALTAELELPPATPEELSAKVMYIPLWRVRAAQVSV